MTPNQLPPLPEPDTHCFDDDTGKDVWSYTTDQMHAYALAALAQQAQPVYQVRGAFSSDPANTWRDTTETAFYFHPVNQRRILYDTPPAPQPAPVDELIEALEDLMAWQVKNVKSWHNRAYDRAHSVIVKHRATLQPTKEAEKP